MLLSFVCGVRLIRTRHGIAILGLGADLVEVVADVAQLLELGVPGSPQLLDLLLLLHLLREELLDRIEQLLDELRPALLLLGVGVRAGEECVRVDGLRVVAPLRLPVHAADVQHGLLGRARQRLADVQAVDGLEVDSVDVDTE